MQPQNHSARMAILRRLLVPFLFPVARSPICVIIHKKFVKHISEHLQTQEILQTLKYLSQCLTILVIMKAKIHLHSNVALCSTHNGHIVHNSTALLLKIGLFLPPPRAISSPSVFLPRAYFLQH